MELRALLYLNLLLLGLYALGLAAVYITSPLLRSVRWLLPFFGICALALLLLLRCGPGQPCFLFVDLLLLGGYVLLDCGIADLIGKRRYVPWLGFALLILQTAGFLWLFWRNCPPASRVLLFSLLAAVQLAASAVRLFRHAQSGTRVANWSLTAVLAATSAFYLARARLGALVWAHPSAVPSPALRLTGLLLLLVSSIGILFGFLWITTEKLRIELQRMARTDSLTGVLNRRAFEAEFARETARCQRSGAPLALLLMDVDHFKFVNDLHGHMTGDTVLRELAALLTRDLRRADLVARLGGEEFAALLPDTDAAQAVHTAERLRAAIELLQVPAANSSVSVTASFGVTAWQGDADAWGSLLQRVDSAMYHAKQAGRNRVRSM